ncbi:MAG TPA: glycogen debranching protein GlgX [Spirochaetota bacterium]|nr:glycogen debranching protein GlgX [Spirochaetota bacterium]
MEEIIQTTKTDPYKTAPGRPHPLGATLMNSSVQFAIFSRHAKGVTLVLMHSGDRDSSYTEIPLDPEINKTGDIWHINVEGIGEGQVYGYRIYGAYNPAAGHRFNDNKLLLDPYAAAITGNFKWDLTRARGIVLDADDEIDSFSMIDSAPHVPRSIVANGRSTCVKNQLRIPENELIIYELHVRGFTAHESSGSSAPGTFIGLTEKIPYLKDLGVNAVELLPIQEFDEYENINVNPVTGEHLKNYWGYSTIAFFAPKGSYSSSGSLGQQVTEFREMVRRFNEAGIEVFLDVVFNHTHEGDYRGPTLSFRGIDNCVYYILDSNKAAYKNYSGCGNTFNCNHPLVRQFILDCLRYWVIEMDVDGFRFDLASILGRDQNGEMLSNPPLIEWIEEDPILRNTKIIAEAWDAGGAYQVGKFPGRWAEWNGRYRDDVRRFWLGDSGFKGAFATRLTGSSDLYRSSSPNRSINFITCHDGFTLNDLVSYSQKHNIENGENNRDGENNNFSCNWGFEGPGAPAGIEELRTRMIKNMTATLLLSLGIPMLLAGDEFRRTQKGNNNSYCQDNEISWVDWKLLDTHNGIFTFTKQMIKFRKMHPVLIMPRFYTGEKCNGSECADISWHGTGADDPGWDRDDGCLAAMINGNFGKHGSYDGDCDFYMMFNTSSVDQSFSLPEAPSGREWRVSINTAEIEGRNIFTENDGPQAGSGAITVKSRSVIVLTA